MNILKLSDRRVGYIVAAVAVLLSTVVPALASAEQVTERSIALSSSSVSAEDVTYQVNFTAASDAGAFVVDFCSDTPVIGQPCTPPTNFDASGAASTSTGFTDVTGSTSKVVVAGSITASDTVSVALTGITNPSVAGPLYARIVTYDTDTNADLYTSEDLGSGVKDSGGVAISITSTFGVSGAVLESLTFCVSGQAITANCASTTTPVLKLGETVGNTVALTPGQLSEGTINAQISTNASSGVVVRLKSDATGCGGLIRAGAPANTCDIKPALNTGIDPDANEAKFGIKTATATDTGINPNGVFQPVSGSFYNNSTYALNYIAGDATGVTSAFGDPFLDTNGAPASNKNMELTFGATVSNNTPAGLYSTDLSLIAVGKF